MYSAEQRGDLWIQRFFVIFVIFCDKAWGVGSGAGNENFGLLVVCISPGSGFAI